MLWNWLVLRMRPPLAYLDTGLKYTSSKAGCLTFYEPYVLVNYVFLYIFGESYLSLGLLAGGTIYICRIIKG